MKYLFRNLLQNDGWQHDVEITSDDSGVITSIEPNKTESDAQIIEGYTLPGFQNAHSHAFQYAMAGLAEVHSTDSNSDSFWSWRDAMYRLALTVDPEHVESIATMLYAEMVRHGYTDVAEFHYLHHQQDGSNYDNKAEMGERLIAAAKKAGINITLVPIFYQRGGFGKDPVEGQKRFLSATIDEYLTLLEASSKACTEYAGANLAMGIHSMRGVEPSDIAEIAQNGPQNIPFHIHIAEQLKEIEDSIDYLGKRPVEWLLDNVDVNGRYNLVHATHLTKEETKGIAESGSNVVLCPTTEGNLGDGLFPLHDYHSFGGNWSIGTDSHVGLNPFEELRLLDYGQRLVTHDRKTFAKTSGDSGSFGIDMALRSGRKAMNNYIMSFFTVGSPLNAAIVRGNIPLLESTANQNLLSTMLYTVDASHQWGTISGGKLIVKDGIHQNYEDIKADFTKTMRALNNR